MHFGRSSPMISSMKTRALPDKGATYLGRSYHVSKGKYSATLDLLKNALGCLVCKRDCGITASAPSSRSDAKLIACLAVYRSIHRREKIQVDRGVSPVSC